MYRVELAQATKTALARHGGSMLISFESVVFARVTITLFQITVGWLLLNPRHYPLTLLFVTPRSRN